MTDTTISPEERQKLRELCEQATPGPWRGVVQELNLLVVSAYMDPPICTVIDDVRWASDAQDHNLAFIAAAREAMPRLLDAYEFVEAALEAQGMVLAGTIAERDAAREDNKRLSGLLAEYGHHQPARSAPRNQKEPPGEGRALTGGL